MYEFEDENKCSDINSTERIINLFNESISCERLYKENNEWKICHKVGEHGNFLCRMNFRNCRKELEYSCNLCYNGIVNK